MSKFRLDLTRFAGLYWKYTGIIYDSSKNDNKRKRYVNQTGRRTKNIQIKFCVEVLFCAVVTLYPA